MSFVHMKTTFLSFKPRNWSLNNLTHWSEKNSQIYWVRAVYLTILHTKTIWYFTCYSNQSICYHTVMIMGFYKALHGGFHDRGYSGVLYGINSIDIMGSCTPEHPAINHNHMVFIMFYYLYWVIIISNRKYVIHRYIVYFYIDLYKW